MLHRTYRLLVAAVLAGSIAGILYGLLNLAFITPLLHIAEGYEHAAHAHTHSHNHSGDAVITIRAALTLGLALSLYIAYGLILAALMHLAHPRQHTPNPSTGPTGIVWGLAGFAACHLAPAFVLSLSLPGLAHTHALPLPSQQIWWWGIAGMVACGLYLTAILRKPASRMVGMVVAASGILIPALILGNAEVASAGGDVPAQLGALFVSRSLGAHALGWVVLGYGVAHFLFAPHKR